MIRLGKWAEKRPLFTGVDRPVIAGISGGATSAMMAALTSTDALLCFQNTGKEDNATYVFLEQLEEHLGRKIVWLEYRPPAQKGAPPCESRWAEVTSRTADRAGAPFEMLLAALKEYRATKGKGPIAPWARSRLCTTYLKTRVARRYVSDHKWERWDELVGLRADEPARVEKLRSGVSANIGRRAPLSEANVTKADVHMFWSQQDFQLQLPSYRGNCTGCFLKDQADLSRSLDENGDAAWWTKLSVEYPGFGGRRFAGYAQLHREAPVRREIEQALREGHSVKKPTWLDERRFALVVIQERKRLAGEVQPFSCACEGAEALANMDDVEENEVILSLPET